MAVRLSRTFLLRKLHQLTGIIPLGVFLLEHFYTNSKALTGADDFNKAVADLQSIPYIIFVEIIGIFIPLIYHALYGIFMIKEMRANNLHYPYPRNWFYTIQRVTGIILFFFITFHVLNFRFGAIPGLNDRAVADNADSAFAIVQGEFANNLILTVYIIGIVSTVWHLANGLWLFAVDWGIVIGERAQRYLGYACIGFGVFLLAVGINAALAFRMDGGLLGGLVK
jgi:succinate dehydrogenase / fumarate reductase cytochrome b subunit